jgi:hypothetical protein
MGPFSSVYAVILSPQEQNVRAPLMYYDLPPKNWSTYYVRIRKENLLKEAG